MRRRILVRGHTVNNLVDDVPDDHSVDRVLQVQDLAASLDFDLLGQIAQGDSLGHCRDGAHLRGQVRSQLVDDSREIAPCALDVED